MGIFDTVTEAFASSTQRTPGASGEGDSAGAYWCDGCGTRVRDVDVDDEGLDRDAEGTPICPDCGESMRFERASGTGCAC
ncbi:MULTISPECIES: hypothetical protein [Haloferacaceae]|uniref:Small CPxCG-related zinc finger protein n=1 Tax=Halorubrum glutamatedens TaxID=2707018 RepID=A0ABD5QQD8_9EURY|nr:hypothetical protein [Halobellus captivus]